YHGAHLGYIYYFSESFEGSIMGEAVFHRIKDVFGDTLNAIYPVTVGVNYLFSQKNAHPYLGINAGVYINSTSVRHSTNTYAYFGLRPTIGFQAHLADHLIFDTSIHYHAVFKTHLASAFGFNIGFTVLIE